MATSFETMLVCAVSLLRELPHGREEVGHARSQFERFIAAHPGIRADLLVDQPPGSLQADFDLLLEHPDGGTVALSWRPDSAMPWSVVYADHWAANFIVTVNNHAVSVQEALLWLKLACDQYPDFMTEVVDQTLIAHAIAENPPAVSQAELQAASDEFRSANHLDSADATLRWLRETGLTTARFENLLSWLIRRRKLEVRATKDLIKPHFHTHREGFDTVRFFRVDTLDKTLAKRLARWARTKGLLPLTHKLLSSAQGRELTGSLESRYVFELPSDLANAPVGMVVGPVAEGDGFWVAQTLGRQLARLDAQTRAAIREQLFQEWLAERRNQATVRWHWM